MASYLRQRKWKVVILPCIAIVLLSLLPQINLWVKRGADWQGAYATLHGDEFLYSGYLNALIEGRPFRNDPFTGSDLKKSLPETTFSIQVVPGFSISSLARTFRVSASTAFIMLAAVSALLAALSVFWLLLMITGDERLAATGVIFVLCLGTFVAEQGLLGLILNRDLLIFGFPFLRRYQPAAVFFLFFVFTGFVWRALMDESKRSALQWSTLAGITSALLVFSYLYLWTAALAWLGCLAVLWVLLNPRRNRSDALGVFVVIAIFAGVSLIPYSYLVSHRAHTLDSAQTMTATHIPDLFRLSEIIGLVVVALFCLAWSKGKVVLNHPRVPFLIGFALLPAIVFNQQILTGRSMQPFHFEDFIVNYVSLVSVVMLANILWKDVPKRVLVWAAALCLLIGIIEMDLPVRAYYQADTVRDEAVPVMKRLSQLPSRDPRDGSAALVFSARSEIMLTLPTWAPQGTLLGIGSLDFGTATQVERKDLFFAYLYFSGADTARLRELFDGKTDDSFLKYYVRSAIFGHERALPSLSYHFQAIEPNEIEQAIRDFEHYSKAFSQQDALHNRLTYLITRSENEGDLSRVDRWYERSPAEHVSQYNLYRLTLRN